jgi:Undecaprenyl-phosphate glucose phosphotransferase
MLDTYPSSCVGDRKVERGQYTCVDSGTDLPSAVPDVRSSRNRLPQHRFPAAILCSRDVRHRPRLAAVAMIVAMILGIAAVSACFVFIARGSSLVPQWPLFWTLLIGSLGAAAAVTGANIPRPPFAARRPVRRVAVVGVNDYSHEFISRMAADPSQTATVIGLYADNEDQVSLEPSCNVLGRLDDLAERGRRERIDAVVLALPLSDLDRIVRSRLALSSVDADIYVAAKVLDFTCKRSRADRLGGHAVIKISSRPLTEWQMLQKGVLDRVLGALLLVLTLPVMLLIAVAIKLDSPGPALFRQLRLGLNGATFVMFKFRSMYHHMADLTADRQTTRDDPRVTPVGRFLRRTSLDELPQLINVLRGDMSLVGPRPHAVNTKAGNELFADAVAEYAQRHRVKPGITGWAQVNGWRGETRTRSQLEQRVAHDLHYIDNWSLKLDLKIILLTAVREFNSKVAF